MALSVVGKRVVRVDAADKATGRTLYIDDFTLPHMLYGKILRSAVPHARILSVDVSRARSHPGVKGVVTARDLPDGRFGPFVKDQPVLASGKVLHIGEPVAAVAAINEDIAEEALSLIQVDYQEMKPLLHPDEALRPDAPLIHEDYEKYVVVFPAVRRGNLCSQTVYKDGDVEQGLKESDYVFEDTFQTPSVHQCYMEPCGAVAAFDSSGKVTVWTNSQAPHITQIRIAEGLCMSMAKIRVVGLRLGGGFGGKVEPHVQPIAVALSRATGRPVKVVLSREEEFISIRPRHPSTTHIVTGVKKDGTLWARKVRIVYDCGAYADDGPGICGFGSMMSRGPYRCPHVYIEGNLVYTNKVGFGAFRGFGNPQATFAYESQMDMIAERLGMDPLEFRLKNAVENGDVQVGGIVMQSVGFKECLKQAAQRAGWHSRKREPNRGMGIACLQHISGVLSSSAVVKVQEDGTVVVQTGAAEIGSGGETILSQVAAEELGVPLEDISIIMADTDACPYNWGTQASRTAYCAGNAVKMAAADAKAQLFKIAAEKLEANPEDLEAAERRVFVKGSPDRAISFRELGLLTHWITHGPVVGRSSFMVEEDAPADPKRVIGAPFKGMAAFIFAAQIVEVEVDQETGQVKVTRVHSAHDVGKAINPLLVEGQIQGGFAQGLGFALSEEICFDGGRVVNPNFLDYKFPSAADMPAIVDPIIVEEAEPTGPFGAKGVGEPGLVPTAPAVANAIYDAVGVRVKELPITPERVVRAFREMNRAG